MGLEGRVGVREMVMEMRMKRDEMMRVMDHLLQIDELLDKLGEALARGGVARDMLGGGSGREQEQEQEQEQGFTFFAFLRSQVLTPSSWVMVPESSQYFWIGPPESRGSRDILALREDSEIENDTAQATRKGFGHLVVYLRQGS